MRTLLSVAVVVAAGFLAAPRAVADDKKPDWFTRSVKSIEATFEPAEAKPGQTVTFRLTVHLNPGCQTYPTKQPDKQAAGMVNTIKFPAAGSVVFVGGVIDPADPKTKAEPEIGIKEMHYYVGKVVYEHKAVVAPTAKPGTVTVKLPSFKLTVCDAINCYPPKALAPEATLKVLAGPAVAVDKAYEEEVKKAGGL
ncbi:hypothetical protein [Fimbriiglobus ruber]|uniref:Cytochrome c-type biogenesis protein DsbD, protein-disulfide reductase n=1 Tax=Fimbriiglobus ruber TaxID=1908690 RepID=A0A225DLK0_9BACT|nr:hypothetical protein [Fimbriiglobus ruber]OWK42340.1 Cytochrome c-type biogenesis protein DsbD, protein-disulfide reductase [Fimbriiglobus ruber]